MAQQTIDRGTVAGDGTGENLFDAFGKVNANFTELYGKWTTLAGTGTGEGASDVGVEDSAGQLAAGNVEAALKEIIDRLAGQGAFTVGPGGQYTTTANLVTALSGETYFTTYSHSVTQVSITSGTPYLRVTAGTYSPDVQEGDWWSPDGNRWYEIEELLGTVTYVLIKLKNNYTGTTLTNDGTAINFGRATYQNVVFLPGFDTGSQMDLSSMNNIAANFIAATPEVKLEDGIKVPKSGKLRILGVDFAAGALSGSSATDADATLQLELYRCKAKTETADIFTPLQKLGMLTLEECDFHWSVDAFAGPLTGGAPAKVRSSRLTVANPETIESGGGPRGRLVSHIDMRFEQCQIRAGIYKADGISANGYSSGGLVFDGDAGVDAYFRDCDIVLGGAGDTSSRDAALYGSLTSLNTDGTAEFENCRISWEKHPSYPDHELVDAGTWSMTGGQLILNHCTFEGGYSAVPASFTSLVLVDGQAEGVSVADAAGNFAGSNVEAALAEAAARSLDHAGGTVDSSVPTVSAFTVDDPLFDGSLVAAISTFTITANCQYAVTINDSNAPAADSPIWSDDNPTPIILPGTGAHTVYGWAKSPAGVVSTATVSDGSTAVAAAAKSCTSATVCDNFTGADAATIEGRTPDGAGSNAYGASSGYVARLLDGKLVCDASGATWSDHVLDTTLNVSTHGPLEYVVTGFRGSQGGSCGLVFRSTSNQSAYCYVELTSNATNWTLRLYDYAFAQVGTDSTAAHNGNRFEEFTLRVQDSGANDVTVLLDGYPGITIDWTSGGNQGGLTNPYAGPFLGGSNLDRWITSFRVYDGLQV